MGQIVRELLFNAPVERVWKVWTDVAKTPEWVEGVQESRITGTVKEGKGLSWQEKCLFGKNVIQMDHEFVEWEPLKRTVTETGLPMGGTMECKAEFRGTPQATQVALELEWDLGMVGALIGEEKLQHMMEKTLNLTAEKWKAKAEGATPPS